MLKNNEGIFNHLQKGIDTIVISLSWFIAYTIRFEFLPSAQQGLEGDFIKFGLVLIFLTLWANYKNSLYRSLRFRNKFTEILSIVKANSSAIFTFIFFLYFIAGDRLSRTTILIYYIISTFLLILIRILVRNFLRTLRVKGRNLRHILLIGDGPQVNNYINAILKYKDSGLRFIGWADSGEQNTNYSDIPRLEGNTEELIEQYHPDAVVVGYSASNPKPLEAFLKSNYDKILPIQILPDLSYSMIGYKIEDFAGVPFLSVNHPNISTLDLILKRSIDFIGSFIGLVILSPIYIATSLAVKLSSPGPIFYKQERVGLNGKKFNMWKFRSMRVATSNEDQNVWGSKDNPRKTKVGELIRKTSIDELPQLWNVLIGEMSLIGPRPERPFFVDQFKDEIPHYMLRHKMKAGITGWAQVNGWRGDTSIRIRIEHDIYYIKNWSLWLDIKIIFLTFWKGFINKNAY